MIFRRRGVNIFSSVELLILFLIQFLAPGTLATAGNDSFNLPIYKIKFTGWRPPAKFTLNLKPGDTFNLKLLPIARQKIQRFLSDQGFLNASIEPQIITERTGIVIIFQIKTGPRARITGWEFDGNEIFTDSELNRLPLPRVCPFSRNTLLRSVTTVQRHYENNGFPFAQIQILRLTETSAGIKPVLSIYEGTRIKISFLTFAGTPGLNQSLLTRIAGFTQPVYYHPAQLNRWRFNLKNSGWIIPESSDIIQRNSLYGVRFWLSPKKTGELAALLGYAPDYHRLIGWADIALLNLFNSGRTAKITWRALYEQTEYQLQYTEPWLLNLPVSVTGSILHQVYDTAYAFTTGTITFTGKFNYDAPSISLTFGMNRLTGLNRKNSLWLGTGIFLDNRNDPANFTSGMSLEVITRGGKQSRPEQGTGLIGWIETGWNLALPLATKIAWTNSLNLRAIYTEMELTEPELYRVGGLGNVRGYREAAFTTDRFIWWNCEIHYSLGNLSWLQLFFDSGVFRRNSGNYVLLAGYGIGARTRTKIGVIGIDFGIPFPESPLHSKIHLTFRTGF